MYKRGFEISFSMLFSIIIIIAIVGVAFYVISSFLSTSKCAEIGLFYNDLKNYINEAWQSTIHQDTFSSSLPVSIELVCIGDLSQTPEQEYKREYDILVREFINYKDRNVFLYPMQKACDSSLSSIKLEHIKTDKFFCVQSENGKIQIKTSRTQFDALVTISK